MFQFFQNWLNRRVIRRSAIAPEQWSNAFASLPLLKGLTADELKTLQELAILFLHHKVFEGAAGLEVTEDMQLIIALQACLPILKLGWGGYDNWVTVIVYPAGFAPERVVRDEYGVEHFVQSHLSGEAWYRGPVILSWEDTEDAGIIDGHNLLIHEFAHKLDMQSGYANGCPLLHEGMSPQAWKDALTAGYEDLQNKCKHGDGIGIDCYATSSPAEYFAVLSEVFFERPGIITSHYPDVYEQLRQYYRQDPLTRLS
jgi:Mlc titration factor MtfA (ptsG expression regulator)